LSALAISLPRLTRRNPLAAIGVVFVIFFTICAVFAPWIAPQDPAHINLATRLSPPSWAQICGSDELGRDILSRLIYGSRISMLVGSCVVAMSLGIGLIVGSIAGYYGGRIDRFVNVIVMNAFLSFPGILIAIAASAWLVATRALADGGVQVAPTSSTIQNPFAPPTAAFQPTTAAPAETRA